MARWMMLIAVVAGIGGFGGEMARAQGPADSTNLRVFDFRLGDVQYRILLPGHATLMARSGADRFHVSLSTRAMRQLELQSASDEGGKTYPHSQSLTNGAHVSFEIIRDAGEYTGGSGGPEETLEGRVQIGGRTLLMRCHDQAEWPGSPRPAWCIDYLHYLAVVRSG